MIEVLSPGVYTTIQDAGRKGHEIHGMPPSGAFDPFLASVANRIAGNSPDAPLIEFALAGPGLRFHAPTTLSLMGTARYRLNGLDVFEARPVSVASGGLLEFTGMPGWFGYLALAGGIVSERILGSASAYIPGRIGRRLAKGDRIHTGPDHGTARLPRKPIDSARDSILWILPGLHSHLFSGPDLQMLAANEFQVLSNSDRMGIALSGPAVASPRVKRSAPAFPGSIQALPSGQLLLLGPEGPTTGGYPQIASLCGSSWTALANSAPGRAVRFAWTTREEALRRLRGREALLQSEDAWEPL